MTDTIHEQFGPGHPKPHTPEVAHLAKILREDVIPSLGVFAGDRCVGPDEFEEVEEMIRKVRQAAAILDPLPPAEQANENYNDMVAVVRAEVDREHRAEQERTREIHRALKRTNDALFAAIGLLEAGGDRAKIAETFGFDSLIAGYKSAWKNGHEVWEGKQ